MADNRQFTDHNEIGGANIYLEDKRLKERSAVGSAAGIANLKFLLANDDTEGFNTAIKAYIDEAVRSAIGTLVDNLDKNTAISRILATDANHDLGTITPANLANVLGGVKPIEKIITDLNDEKGEQYRYMVYMLSGTSAPANMPSAISTSDRAIIEILRINSDIIQKITARGSSTTYQRTFGIDTWTAWKEL